MQIIIVLLTLFFLSLSYSSSFGDQIHLTLIYSSNTLGEVESGCYPETGNAGGLARRSHYIKGVKEGATNLLVLDGGDALVIGPPGDEKERAKARKKAEVVLKIYEKMGYFILGSGILSWGQATVIRNLHTS